MGSIQKEWRFFFYDVERNIETELKHDLDGWRALGVSYGRTGPISNIVKENTSDWIYIKEDAEYLKQVIFNYGVNYRIKLLIKKLVNWKESLYNIEFSGFIDLTNATWNNLTLSAPIFDGGLFKSMDNKWNELYDIPLNRDLKFSGKTFYESQRYEQFGNFFRAGEDLEFRPRVPTESLIILGGTSPVINDNLHFLKNEFDNSFFLDTNRNLIDPTITPVSLNEGYSFLNIPSGYVRSLNLTWEQQINIKCYVGAFARGNYNARVSLNLLEIDTERLNNGNAIYSDGIAFILQERILPLGEIPLGRSVSIDETLRFSGSKALDSFQINKKKSYLLCYLITWNYDNGYFAYLNPEYNFSYTLNNSSFEINDVSILINSNKTIQTISQIDIFKTLIDKINIHNYSIEYDIGSFETISRSDFLSNGVGMRGIQYIDRDQTERKTFYIQTSLGSFLEWIYVAYDYRFGLDYDKDNDKYKITLKHESNFYNSEVINRFDKIGDISFKLYRDKFYSSVKCGYVTKDDSINGLTEYNTIFNWTTPYSEIEENILELISPYSAAVNDAETYIYENYGNFNDGNDRDSDIFVFSCTSDGGTLILKRDIPVQSPEPYPEDLWNISLTPKRIMLAHQRELNSYFNLKGYNNVLMLNTVERYGGLIAGGLAENADIYISNDIIFQPIIISFDAPAPERLINSIERNKMGVFEFKFKESYLKGYISFDSSSLRINPMNEDFSQFVLLSHPQNEL